MTPTDERSPMGAFVVKAELELSVSEEGAGVCESGKQADGDGARTREDGVLEGTVLA